MWYIGPTFFFSSYSNSSQEMHMHQAPRGLLSKRPNQCVKSWIYTTRNYLESSETSKEQPRASQTVSGLYIIRNKIYSVRCSDDRDGKITCVVHMSAQRHIALDQRQLLLPVCINRPWKCQYPHKTTICIKRKRDRDLITQAANFERLTCCDALGRNVHWTGGESFAWDARNEVITTPTHSVISFCVN